jgi:hypothetical protein
MKRNMLSRSIAGALMFTLTACTTFGPVSAREYLPIAHPTNIWITTEDNHVVKMQAPKLLGDTLVGYVNGDFQEVRLSQAKQIQARQMQPGRTAMLIGAGVLGIVVVGKLVSGSAPPCASWVGTGNGGQNGGTYGTCLNQTVH